MSYTEGTEKQIEALPTDSVGQCAGPNVSKRRGIFCCIGLGMLRAKSEWPILMGGQILSFLFASSGAAQASISFVCGLSAPSFTIGLFYFCMSFFLIPVYRTTRLKRKTQEISQHLELSTAPDTKKQKKHKTFSFFCGCFELLAPVKIYVLMALLDVYANYFTVLALHYTTITSVTLLDALSIPAAMILSRCLLKRTYSWVHLFGALLCMAGVVMNVTVDLEYGLKYKAKHHNHDHDLVLDEYPHQTQGNLMAVAGGVLFGASSVVGEAIVHHEVGPNEYVGMLGFFGAIICAIHTMVFETNDVNEFVSREPDPNSTCSKSTAQILLLAYVIINVINYLGRAWFLQVSEAAFLNLSLLTGDMWSVLFSVFAQKIFPEPLFYLALIITLTGVFVYEMADSPIIESQYRSQNFGDSDCGSDLDVDSSSDNEGDNSLENLDSSDEEQPKKAKETDNDENQIV